MKLLPYILVLLSAFIHAYWNFVLKRERGGQVFIGLSKLSEIVIFSVPFVYFVVKDEIALLDYWEFYVIGAFFAIANYFFLGQAYKSGDLSVVYPISRGAALLFLPPLAYFFIGEKVDGVGLLAILLIMIGLSAIQLSAFNLGELRLVLSKLKNSASLYALLAAFMVACYTLWDKHSVAHLPPFIYFYAYTVVTGLSYGVFIFARNSRESIKTEWLKYKYSIIQVGLFNTFAYLLILFSLQTGKASYVIALRQLSIAFGVFLGWKILGETFFLPKKTGVLFLVSGCLLISLAR